MNNGKIHEIFNSDKDITLEEYRNIIYDLINDCVFALSKQGDIMYQRFYNGEINAFYIAFDLSEKIVDFNHDIKESEKK